MDDDAPPRWHLRLDTFARIVELLKEAIDLDAARGLSDLEREGLIQRFEMAWEQGWKLLRDYLASEGAIPQPASPNNVVRTAFATGVIADGDGWMAVAKARNTLSHAYDRAARDAIAAAIAPTYLPLFAALRDMLLRLRDG